MRKKILFVLFSAGLLATTNGFGQFILTQTAVAFAVGDTISIEWAQPANFTNPGSAGANQSWDFSGMASSIQGKSDYSMLDASTVPHANSFPSANIASLNGNGFTFYNIDSTVMQILGGADTANVGGTYTNPEDQLRFPLSFNNTYTDHWRSSSYTDLNNNRYLNGTITVTADAYGTIITPTQTFKNAMRIRTVEAYADSNTAAGTLYVVPWYNVYYKWYVNGIHWPVAEIDSISWDFGAPASGYDFFCLYSINGNNGFTTGVKENVNHNSLSAYPNPVSNVLNLDINLPSSQKVEIRVFNSMGSEVQVPLMQSGLEGDNRYRINVQNLPQGIYFARIKMDGVLSSMKQFVVER